jgi:hypothetical protein
MPIAAIPRFVRCPRNVPTEDDATDRLARLSQCGIARQMSDRPRCHTNAKSAVHIARRGHEASVKGRRILAMQRMMEPMPPAIRIWVVGGVVRASIPRSVVRAPMVIDHRRDSTEKRPSNRELYDLALNVLNGILPPVRDARGEQEPVKCFRGHCSAFAARYHCDFAREFLQDLREAHALETAEIRKWIERRRQLAASDLGDTESYLEAVPA